MFTKSIQAQMHPGQPQDAPTPGWQAQIEAGEQLRESKPFHSTPLRGDCPLREQGLQFKINGMIN